MKDSSKWYGFGFLLVLLFMLFFGTLIGAILMGIIPALIIFVVLLIFRKFVVVRSLKHKKTSDLITIALGWGATIGLILILISYIIFPLA